MPGFAFALSISHFVSSVGADAGFAAIIGLAVLVLLYFAQARETATLRERAAVLEARAQQLESRLSAVTRGGSGATAAPPPQPGAGAASGVAPSTAAGAPVPQPAFLAPRPISGAPLTDAPLAGSPVAAPNGAQVRVSDQRAAGRSQPPLLPAAPAGTAGPALAAATRLIPIARSAAWNPGASAPPAPAPASAPPVSAPAASSAASSASSPPAPPAPPVPAPAAPAHRLVAADAPASPAPATAAGAANGSRVTAAPEWVAPPAAAAPPQRPAPVAAGRAGAPTSPRRDFTSDRGRLSDDSEGPPRSRAGRLLTGALVALLVIGIAAVLIAVTSGGGGSSNATAPQARTTNSPLPNRQRATSFDPTKVTVAVLNGTSTSGLAHRIQRKLGQLGYRPGSAVTAPDQTHTATVVAYLPGNRAAALHVARALNLGPASVQPVDAATQGVACPPPGSCAAQVVVTVGADLATAA